MAIICDECGEGAHYWAIDECYCMSCYEKLQDRVNELEKENDKLMEKVSDLELELEEREDGD